LIVIVQRSKKKKGARKEEREKMDVRAGRDGICLSCLAHVPVAET
jgi:hypothetical protein